MMPGPPPLPKDYGDTPIHCSACNTETTIGKVTAHPETGAPLCIPCFKDLAKKWGYGDMVKDLT